jgi:uncharacterized membrane protein
VDDTDRDGLPDGKEQNVINSNPNESDSDGDNLSDGVEWEKPRTSPIMKDSDNDSLSDSKEINKLSTNPTKPDTDGDGLTDNDELQKPNTTDPTEPDTDGDGLPDRQEINVYKTDPNEPDTDDDSLNDNVEVKEQGTNPNVWDQDGDGLGDGAEVNKYGTEPKKVDSDGDGVNDATEINQGTDPNGPVLMIFGYSIERPRMIGIGAAVGLLAIIGGGYWWRRRKRGTRDETQDVDSAETIGDSAKPELAAEREQKPDEVAVSKPLTDEDRILQLLSESDGRLRQSEIVAETGWSKSKVSRLLSRMEEDDRITKITVGRENLITRSGDEPKHAGSAFED